MSICNYCKGIKAASDSVYGENLRRVKLNDMQEKPIVTVIIPSLNVAPYIRQCMDSVLNQTLKDIEVFVVDANSTDGTHEILEEYAKKDSRITLFDDIKKSTGYAKNIGIDQGRGKYYAVVESDDYIELDMFENMVNIAEETGADIVKGNYNNFLGEGTDQRDFPSTVSSFPEDYERLNDPKKDNHCFTWGMFEWLGIYRMDFLKKHNIRHNETKGAAYQDTGFWFMTFAYANGIYLTNKPYYNYRRDNPLSSMKSSGKVFGICTEYEYINECLADDAETRERTKSAWYRCFFYDNCVACNRLAPEGKRELADRMREVMLEGRDANKIDKSLYSNDEWTELQRLFESVDVFLENRYLDEERRSENRKRLSKKAKEAKDVLIFGAGWYGCNLQFILENMGIHITAFVDNDKNKWGIKRNALVIKSPEACKVDYPVALYLIANKDHSSDIEAGLISMGIPEGRIEICRLEALTDAVV